jgi:hypothetical protein
MNDTSASMSEHGRGSTTITGFEKEHDHIQLH